MNNLFKPMFPQLIWHYLFFFLAECPFITKIFLYHAIYIEASCWFFTHIHTFLDGTISIIKNKSWPIFFLSSLRQLAEWGISTQQFLLQWLLTFSSQQLSQDLSSCSFSSFVYKFLASKSITFTYYYWLSYISFYFHLIVSW